MKRDLYAEVSARIVAELEAGAAPWVKPWSATPGANTPCNALSNRPYSGCNVVLLWMAQAAGYRTPRFLTLKQALELGGNVRKGEHGTKVYFVKQLQVRDQGVDDNSPTRLIPMMREYTVFNVDQCENLPDSVSTGKLIRGRNPETRDGGLRIRHRLQLFESEDQTNHRENGGEHPFPMEEPKISDYSRELGCPMPFVISARKNETGAMVVFVGDEFAFVPLSDFLFHGPPDSRSLAYLIP